MLEFREGDQVILTSNRPPEWADGGQMDMFLGQIMTIEKISRDDVVFTDVRTQQWSFKVSDIDRFIDEEKEKIRIAEAKELWGKYSLDAHSIQDIANEVFGAERVGCVKTGSLSFDIIIHFPEFTITNSREDSHVIKDLYVKFCIHPRTVEDVHKVSINFYGTRTTLHLKEYASNYGHSHLPSGCLCEYRGFCLGSSEFGLIINSLLIEPTPEGWYLLFFSLENYLIWESLEGGPYIKMAGIGYGLSSDSAQANVEFYRLLPNIPEEVFQYNEGIKVIAHHPTLLEFYKENSKVRDLGITRDRIKELLKRRQENVKRLSLNFKGEKIGAKIYDESVDEIEDKTSIPLSGDVINYYNQLLKEELNKFNLDYGYQSAKTLRYQAVFG
ncbi:MAG: hypothetical protein WCP46_00265 [Alphaproteobacteria bacterium]